MMKAIEPTGVNGQKPAGRGPAENNRRNPAPRPSTVAQEFVRRHDLERTDTHVLAGIQLGDYVLVRAG